MRLAHLADLHLGFRQYSRQTASGINQREADVARAFRQAVEGLITAEPDLVVIAGDVFHSVRPPNPAILDSFHQLPRVREALPRAPVVVLAGNHDTPRSSDTGSILQLFEAIPEVYVILREPRAIEFPDRSLTVTGIPHATLISGGMPDVRPDASSTWNVLIQHCEIPGIISGDRSAFEYGGAVVEAGDLHADRWDYVALGHYHVAHQVLPNAWYAGATEYTSTNPWTESREGAPGVPDGTKGWLLVDLETDGPAVQFQPIAPARRHIDLPPIYATGMTAEAVTEAIAHHASAVEQGIASQVVRQVVYDIPRAVSRDLDHALIRELKTTALHYHLDLRRPAPTEAVGVVSAGRRQPLREVVREYLETRPTTPGVDREALIEMGMRYLDETGPDMDLPD